MANNQLGMQDKGFSVSIIGVGKNPSSVGWQVSQNLLQLSELEKIILFHRVQGNRTPSAERLKDFLEQNNREESRNRIEMGGYDLIKDSNIAIVCVDASNYKEKLTRGSLQRIDVLNDNYAPMLEVTNNLVSLGYGGQVIIATNPTDIMAHIASAHGLKNVQGFNHPDTFRFRDIIKKAHNEELGTTFEYGDIEGYILGPHGEGMIPLYSSVMLPKHFKYTYSPLNEAEINKRIQERVKEFGTKLIKEIGTSSVDVGPAMKELIEAILFKDRYVESSIFFKLSENLSLIPDIKDRTFLKNDNGIFMGMPIRFIDERGHIKQISLTEDEQKQLVRAYSAQQIILEKLIEGTFDKKIARIPLISKEIISAKIEDTKLDENIIKRATKQTGLIEIPTPAKLKPSKVEIPSNLEVKLYTPDTVFRGEEKRIAEFDFKSNEARRYFSYKPGKSSGYDHIFTDGKSLYATYSRIRRRIHDEEFGVVFWDLGKGELIKHIALEDNNPSSLFVHKGDIYLSFTDAKKGSIRRYLSKGSEESYTGIEAICSVVVAELADGLRILGSDGNQLYAWREDTFHKPEQQISAEDNLFDLRNFKQGFNIISARSKDKVILIDLEGTTKPRAYATYEGIYDMAIQSDGKVTLATLGGDDGKVKVRLYDDLSKLMKGEGNIVMDHEQRNVLQPYPEVYKLQFIGDLILMLDRTKESITILDWKNQEREHLVYSPMATNLFYTQVVSIKC